VDCPGVCLRVLGFWKSVSFAAVHRILPIGFFGVLMNVFTGMLMMMADTYRYVVTDTTFAPKMALIPIGVIAITGSRLIARTSARAQVRG